MIAVLLLFYSAAIVVAGVRYAERWDDRRAYRRLQEELESFSKMIGAAILPAIRDFVEKTRELATVTQSLVEVVRR